MPEPVEQSDSANAGSWLKRGAWFVGLWFAGVAVVGTVAYVIRSMIL